MYISIFTFCNDANITKNGQKFTKNTALRIKSKSPRATIFNFFGSEWGFEYDDEYGQEMAKKYGIEVIDFMDFVVKSIEYDFLKIWGYFKVHKLDGDRIRIEFQNIEDEQYKEAKKVLENYTNDFEIYEISRAGGATLKLKEN